MNFWKKIKKFFTLKKEEYIIVYLNSSPCNFETEDVEVALPLMLHGVCRIKNTPSVFCYALDKNYVLWVNNFLFPNIMLKPNLQIGLKRIYRYCSPEEFQTVLAALYYSEYAEEAFRLAIEIRDSDMPKNTKVTQEK